MKRVFIRSFSFLLVGVMALSLSGCGFRSNSTSYKIDLEVWGVFDDTDAFQGIFSKYKGFGPNVGDISYKKLSVDSYKQDLIEAIAAGRGPDIFMVRNSWIPYFQDKIAVAPGGFFNERSYRDTFVDTVADDFLGDAGEVFGVALWVDSLALYYNEDLFNASGIAFPPKTWDEFLDDVKTLTRINSFGEITRAGVALGTNENINRSTDVLNMLFLQNGAISPRANGRSIQIGSGAGSNALNFYLQFANPTSPFYTWNPTMHYSIDAFYEGTVAMMINYSWHYDTIKRKNSKLNFSVATLPRPVDAQPVNFPNYWGFVVAKNKPQKENSARSSTAVVTDAAQYAKIRVFESWQLLKYLSYPKTGTITLRNAITGNSKDIQTTYDPAAVYLQQTRRPAARRDLVEKQRNSPVLGPFADGNLIARSWRQPDAETVENIFGGMITSINLGQSTFSEALGVAQTRIDRLSK